MKYFPYKQDKAGTVRDKHETGEASEALLAATEILALAKELLPKDTYLEAERMANMLTQSKSDKAAARAQLISVLPPPPKRPIYYLAREIRSLPRWTRNAMRFLGDYVDMLAKAAVYEVLSDRDLFGKAFGPTISKFRVAYPKENTLADYLSRYNKFLYRDAKHDMTLPVARREHRFTSREVVLCIYISKELARRIISLSELARKVNNDQPMS